MDRLNKFFGSDWKEFKPNYFVSLDGRSAKVGKRGAILLIGCSAGQMGYRAITYAVELVDGKRKHRRFYIHRAVCEAFNGPGQPGQYCMHNDGNHLNNSASNLRWGSAAENSADMVRHRTRMYGERNPMAVLTQDAVDRMRSIRAMQKTPYYVIARDFGVSTMTAFRAVTGRAWQ